MNRYSLLFCRELNKRNPIGNTKDIMKTQDITYQTYIDITSTYIRLYKDNIITNYEEMFNAIAITRTFLSRQKITINESVLFDYSSSILDLNNKIVSTCIKIFKNMIPGFMKNVLKVLDNNCLFATSYQFFICLLDLNNVDDKEVEKLGIKILLMSELLQTVNPMTLASVIFHSISGNTITEKNKIAGKLLFNQLIELKDFLYNFDLNNNQIQSILEGIELKTTIEENNNSHYQKIFDVPDPAPPKGFLIIENNIGSGTFSEIFKCSDANNRKLAIKCTNTKTLDTNHWTATIREISILKNCYHDNILKILDIKYKSVISASFIMDRYDCNLVRFLFKTSNKQHLFEIYTSVLEALKYLHDRNIIHGDIKEENIFIKQNDCKIETVLGDFGISCPNNDATLSKTDQIYTVTTRPPECFHDRNIIRKTLNQNPEIVKSNLKLLNEDILKNEQTKYIYTTASDMWALGKCLIYSFTDSTIKNINFSGYPDFDSYMFFYLLRLYGTQNYDKYSYFSCINHHEEHNFDMIKEKEVVDVIHSVMKIDPTKRATAKECLRMFKYKVF